MEMAEIQLSNGGTTIVDPEDVPRLTGYTWYNNGHGYAYAYVKRSKPYRRVWMHRLIIGTPDDMDTDHINGNKLDNRKSNLRCVTRRQNVANRPKLNRSCSSRYKGVHWHKQSGYTGRWRARASFKRDGDTEITHLHLGLFDDEVEAARAWDRWARQYFGNDYVILNFP
jgi:hypothetical protein